MSSPCRCYEQRLNIPFDHPVGPVDPLMLPKMLESGFTVESLDHPAGRGNILKDNDEYGTSGGLVGTFDAFVGAHGVSF